MYVLFEDEVCLSRRAGFRLYPVSGSVSVVVVIYRWEQSACIEKRAGTRTWEGRGLGKLTTHTQKQKIIGVPPRRETYTCHFVVCMYDNWEVRRNVKVLFLSFCFREVGQLEVYVCSRVHAMRKSSRGDVVPRGLSYLGQLQGMLLNFGVKGGVNTSTSLFKGNQTHGVSRVARERTGRAFHKQN